MSSMTLLLSIHRFPLPDAPELEFDFLKLSEPRSGRASDWVTAMLQIDREREDTRTNPAGRRVLWEVYLREKPTFGRSLLSCLRSRTKVRWIHRVHSFYLTQFHLLKVPQNYSWDWMDGLTVLLRDVEGKAIRWAYHKILCHSSANA